MIIFLVITRLFAFKLIKYIPGATPSAFLFKVFSCVLNAISVFQSNDKSFVAELPLLQM